MADRHAGHHANRSPRPLGFVGDGLQWFPRRVHVDCLVVRPHPGTHRRRRRRRVGVGMHPRLVVGGFGDQVPRVGRSAPGPCSAPAHRIPTRAGSPRVDDLLRVDIDLRTIVLRRGHHPAKLRGPPRLVVLKVQSLATSFAVGHLAALPRGRRPRCLPVHAIEDHQHDVLLARLEGGALQPGEVGLIEILRVGIERLRGDLAIQPLQPLGGPVGTRLSLVVVEINPGTGLAGAKGVDGNDPQRVRTPRNVLAWIGTPPTKLSPPLGDPPQLQVAGQIDQRLPGSALPPGTRQPCQGQHAPDHALPAKWHTGTSPLRPPHEPSCQPSPSVLAHRCHRSRVRHRQPRSIAGVTTPLAQAPHRIRVPHRIGRPGNWQSGNLHPRGATNPTGGESHPE